MADRIWGIDDYVLADFSDTAIDSDTRIVKGSLVRASIELVGQIAKGSLLRASIELVRRGTDPACPTSYFVQTRDLRSNGFALWLPPKCIHPPSPLEEKLFSFNVGKRTLAAVNFCGILYPGKFAEVVRLSDNRTNRYRAPLRIVYEVLFAMEGSSAHGGRDGGYRGDPADTEAVRKSAKALRRSMEVFLARNRLSLRKSR